MSGAGFLRVGKLKGNSIIKASAGHNKRSIPTDEKVDPTRTHLNYALAGPAIAGDVAQLAKDLMAAAGLDAIRKDAVRGLEVVFSLSPDHQLNERDYFADCVAWAVRYYGGVTLSADVHLDESAPHCHLILLPLVNGRMVGNKLVGYKKELSALQNQFHLDVASRYGLSKAPPKLTGAAKEAAVKAVLQKMRETGDKALQSVVWAVIRDNIENDPAPFLVAYGIELQAPAKKLRTMAQIFTSTGKGKSKETNTIAFAPPEKDRRLCSVAFAAEAPPPPAASTLVPPPGQHSDDVDQPLTDIPNADGEVVAPTRPGPAPLPLPALTQLAAPQPATPTLAPPPSPAFVDQITRHRDCDLDPACYDLTSGDYIPTRPPALRRHKQTCDAALMALKDLQVRQMISFSVGV